VPCSLQGGRRAARRVQGRNSELIHFSLLTSLPHATSLPLHCHFTASASRFSPLASGRKVVDVRGMKGYPLCDGLAKAMKKAQRPWLKQ
jgi:hypothetical protein